MNHQFSRPQDSACLEVQDTLEAYLANELDAETHARIAAHVTSCPTCQDEVHFAQTISEALHELPRPEPPPAVFDAVAAYVRAHPDKGERWWHRLFQLFTFWDNLTFALVRAGCVGMSVWNRGVWYLSVSTTSKNHASVSGPELCPQQVELRSGENQHRRQRKTAGYPD